MENLDMMLGIYSRIGVDSQLNENEENLNQMSNEWQTNTNPSVMTLGLYSKQTVLEIVL